MELIAGVPSRGRSFPTVPSPGLQDEQLSLSAGEAATMTAALSLSVGEATESLHRVLEPHDDVPVGAYAGTTPPICDGVGSSDNMRDHGGTLAEITYLSRGHSPAEVCLRRPPDQPCGSPFPGRPLGRFPGRFPGRPPGRPPDPVNSGRPPGRPPDVPLQEIHSTRNTLSLLSDVETCMDSDDLRFVHEAFDFGESEDPPWAPFRRTRLALDACRVDKSEGSPRIQVPIGRTVPHPACRVFPPPASAEGVESEVPRIPIRVPLGRTVPHPACRVFPPLISAERGKSEVPPRIPIHSMSAVEESQLRPGAPPFLPSYAAPDVPAVYDVYRRVPPSPPPASVAFVSAECDYPLLPSMARRFKALCDGFVTAENLH